MKQEHTKKLKRYVFLKEREIRYFQKVTISATIFTSWRCPSAIKHDKPPIFPSDHSEKCHNGVKHVFEIIIFINDIASGYTFVEKYSNNRINEENQQIKCSQN